jgi:ribonuclease R
MYSLNDLNKMALHLSNREKVAQKASRDSIKYKQCEFLLNKIGSVFNGVITSIQEYGLFIEIPENGCDGFCKLIDITPSGNNLSEWVSDTRNYCVYDKIFGSKLRVGDSVTVVIKSVDIERKEINLIIL